MSTLRSKHRKPTHPGAILREDVLPSLGAKYLKPIISSTVGAVSDYNPYRDQIIQ